jgi:hypothetical protein
MELLAASGRRLIKCINVTNMVDPIANKTVISDTMIKGIGLNFA